jgi:hypothetical protein
VAVRSVVPAAEPAAAVRSAAPAAEVEVEVAEAVEAVLEAQAVVSAARTDHPRKSDWPAG